MSFVNKRIKSALVKTLLSFKICPRLAVFCVWTYQHPTSMWKSIRGHPTIVSSVDMRVSVTQLNTKENIYPQTTVQVTIVYSKQHISVHIISNLTQVYVLFSPEPCRPVIRYRRTITCVNHTVWIEETAAL